MNRFFIEAHRIKESHIEISGEDAIHILRVLRLGVGDLIELCDGAGMDYPATIVKGDKDRLTVELGAARPSEAEPSIKVTLYQGMPKSNKMDFIIQKSIELGINSIVPLETARTIVKLSEAKRTEKRVARWQKIAEMAAKQSKRGKIPKIGMPVAYPDIIREASHSIKIIPWEGEACLSLREYLENRGHGIYESDIEDIGIVIGPEGGFEDEEIVLAKEYGWDTVTLGPRILRTETAGLATLAAIMFYMGEME